MNETAGEYSPLPFGNEGNCFGCGLGNGSGLGMKFHSDGTRVVSRLVVPDHLCGWGNLVHGGISATIVDEIMGWTAMFLLKRFVLTRSLSVRYLKPLFAGRKIRVEGSLVEEVNEREAEVRAEIYNDSGELCVSASGRFALYTAAGARRLGFFDPRTIEEMAEKFLR